MNNREWFRQAQYGMMAHWGLYSLLAGEYKGKRYDDNDELLKGWAPIGEWIMPRYQIPIAEYEKLAQAFNPVFFDADEWIRLAKECGMEYFVFTSKHHDGFAMFKSEADNFNVVDASPFGRDIVAELGEACYKHGLKFGLYYSQELDWHHPHGGGTGRNPIYCSGVSWDNTWDFPDDDKKDFSICFEEKIKPQVKEILTKYGDLCLIWFDVPYTISPEQSLELNRMVKEYQPECLINSRIGNGAYDYVSLGDNEYPSEFKVEENSDPNSLDGLKFSPKGLYETAGTMNSSWGFKYYDNNWISPEEIADRRKRLNSMGINYLLNVGPDGLGRIPSVSAENLLKAEALYGLVR